MRDRIVPVTRTDLANLYYTMFNAAGVVSSANASLPIIGADAPGEFTLASTGFCEEPLKSATVTDSDSSSRVFFIPTFDYVGFTDANGAIITTTGDTVNPDGRTLYRALLADSGVEITKVSM